MTWFPVAQPELSIDTLKPMLVSRRTDAVLDGRDWLYEVMRDGYRLLAGVEGGTVRLRSRLGADANAWFPELAQALSRLRGGPHVLDGEVVVQDALGRDDYAALHLRAKRRRWTPGDPPVVFHVFDLLIHQGEELVELPIEERKRRLALLAPSLPPCVVLAETLGAEVARSMFAQAAELGIQGLVAKRRGSPYRAGERSVDWMKLKVASSAL